MDELRAEKDCVDEIVDSPEVAERLLEQCGNHRDSSLDACMSTIMEGEALLQELRFLFFIDCYVRFRKYKIVGN